MCDGIGATLPQQNVVSARATSRASLANIVYAVIHGITIINGLHPTTLWWSMHLTMTAGNNRRQKMYDPGTLQELERRILTALSATT